ncbi:MAG TPA: DUF6288 domain-containing protein [Planctomycetota bacterium]|jgi:hypothetical protein|nr:DUF6288 domain-containing protein [Planctomycetota bacterium]
MQHLLLLTLAIAAASPASAQVHHFPNGRPWNRQARRGPDAEVQGWLYNLGVTGIRVKLEDEHPTHLIVGHVFEGTPATGKVRVGDRIVGARGLRFETPHRNGYGMDKFGPDGPIADFAEALERALDSKERELRLQLDRDGKRVDVKLKLPAHIGPYEESFPFDCDRTVEIRERLWAHLAEQQRGNGSWGNPIHDTFIPLTLLASGRHEYRDEVERSARYHAQNTSTKDTSGLVNWKYMAAAVVLSEWYLATKDRWVLGELQEIYDFLCTTQYLELSQVNPKVRESHPHAYPKNAEQQYGGWGHNPGFEGYGPIAMITGQGALALALMDRCGIEIDEGRHLAAYEFLQRGTGSNGYLWYGDSVAGDRNWADMGRTGTSAIAHWMSPHREHRKHALVHAKLMGEQPRSFPDTHASPLMGMAYGALGTSIDKEAFEALMEANRWWFLLAECPDGTFAYQPNRDNNGYGNDARLLATGVTAFIYSIPLEGLVMTGKKAR